MVLIDLNEPLRCRWGDQIYLGALKIARKPLETDESLGDVNPGAREYGPDSSAKGRVEVRESFTKIRGNGPWVSELKTVSAGKAMDGVRRPC
jgi:hypothetical protein